MKKKIVGVLVVTLLMLTVLTATGKINFEQISKRTNTSSFDGDDVPTWEEGYSWTYTGGVNIDEGGFLLNIDLNEAYFGVVDDSGDSYTLTFGGDIEGEFTIVDPPVGITSDMVSGNIYVTKSTMGISQLDISMSGRISMMGFPVPLPGTADITITFDPDFAIVEFPIMVGNNWIIPPINVTIDVEVTLLGIIKKTFKIEEAGGNISASCTSQEDVVAGTETYTAYNISYGVLWIYYAPSVGNFVKMVPAGDTVDFSLELIATSYPSPDNPLKPDTPSGETNGQIGQSYDYSTKAIDPNDDQIKYGWDWDGDLIPDEWTGWYDSDVAITASHTWTEQGNYDIRVKARDTNGLESEWSDPLPVTMPVNHDNIVLQQSSSNLINRPNGNQQSSNLLVLKILKVMTNSK